MKRFPMDAVDLWFIVISLIRLYGSVLKIGLLITWLGQ